MYRLRNGRTAQCTKLPDSMVMQIVKETIPALQKLREQGLVRAIGFSGLPLDIYPYVLDR